jgi:hypothetical protein
LNSFPFYPFQRRKKRKFITEKKIIFSYLSAFLYIALQIVGIISSSPNFFFFTTVDMPEENRVVCYAEWPDADKETNHSLLDYV